MKHTLLSTSFFALSTLIGLSPVVAQPGGTGVNDVVITEIMYNPPEAGTDTLEFIELYNPNSTAIIDLSGYYFSSGFEYTFPPGVMLPAEEFMIIAKDSVAFNGVSGALARQWTSQSLLNTGEAITLRNSLNAVVDTVNYNDNAPWPTEPDGAGPSLILCDVNADNNDGNNWAASQQASGTIINSIEIFADPYALETCMPVGLNDEVNTDDLAIYPNPSNGQFEIRLGKIERDINFELFDVSGKVVFTESLHYGNSGNLQLNLDLPNGVYILRVGESYSRLVISK